MLVLAVVFALLVLLSVTFLASSESSSLILSSIKLSSSSSDSSSPSPSTFPAPKTCSPAFCAILSISSWSTSNGQTSKTLLSSSLLPCDFLLSQDLVLALVSLFLSSAFALIIDFATSNALSFSSSFSRPPCIPRKGCSAGTYPVPVDIPLSSSLACVASITSTTISARGSDPLRSVTWFEYVARLFSLFAATDKAMKGGIGSPL
mmetsp:Transcript_14608/g.29956  ORF Transcript_14608/g.29956 Transcript_14608/m.29956 type:complete len:205 (+) Transcript_14608:1134-1748(+)